MKKIQKYSVILLVIFVHLTGAFYGQAKMENSYITFLIRNPKGCTHFITLDESGSGQLKAGRETNYYTDFNGLKDSYKVETFSISDEDKNSIQQMVNRLKSEDIIETKRPKDAVHYELFVYKTKKIDAYARKSEMVNSLKGIIQSALPFTIDHFCEAYVQQ